MELPAKWGRYQLVEHLGGGMAEVYRAQDTVIGRTVAVKMLSAKDSANAEAKARFLREAKMAGNIEHENIIHIYDFGEVDGRPYMVMEYLWGDDLRQAMQKHAVGDFAYRIHIALGVARAFEHIHSLGIIHRDIKPENIYVDAVGKVKLVDFGIAKSKDLTLTRAGFTLGTPSYMAPEQVMGADVTPLVDIYAFGVLLFELFTGRKPIQGKTVAETFQKILKEPVDFTPLERSGAGGRIVTLVRRLMQKKPEDRPANFTEVSEQLEVIQAEMAEGVYDVSVPQPSKKGPPDAPEGKTRPGPARKKPWLIPALAAAVLVAASVLLLTLRQTGTSESDAVAVRAPPGMLLITGSPDFFIDQAEVSVGDYARFAEETHREAPAGAAGQPVTNITIDDARAYARWAGKRLPSAIEWDRAAGGQYNLLGLANNIGEFVLEFRAPSQAQVDRFALLLAPPPSAEESWCLVRGGPGRLEEAGAAGELVPARYASDTIGFRCAKDAP